MIDYQTWQTICFRFSFFFQIYFFQIFNFLFFFIFLSTKVCGHFFSRLCLSDADWLGRQLHKAALLPSVYEGWLTRTTVRISASISTRTYAGAGAGAVVLLYFQSRSQSLLTSYGACSTKMKALERTNS